MTLNEFYDEVARRADTDKTKINAAETRRVLAVAFSVLSSLDGQNLTEVIAKGLGNAKKKASK